MATYTNAYRTIVTRDMGQGDRAVYVVETSLILSPCLDAIHGAIATVEGMLGGPISGTLTVEVQCTCVMFPGEPDSAQINRAADEDEWRAVDEDDWDYAARILRHPEALARQK